MKKKNFLMRQLDLAVYLVIRVTICCVQSISMETCHFLSVVLSFIFTDIIRVRRRLVMSNFERAFPEKCNREKIQLLRKMWQHLFLMMAEIAKAPRIINEYNWYRYASINRAGRLINAELDSRPVILVTAHFGNFELGGYLLGILGYPTFAVARTIDNPYLDRFIKNFREMTGQFLVSKKNYDEILDILSKNGTVTFLADQSAGPRGIWVDFFGHKASAYKAMALLSFEYDAPIFVCYSTRVPGRPMHIQMRELGMFDPRHPGKLTTTRQVTQWFTSILEDAIRQDPDQYWWIHNRWKTYGKKFE